MARNLLKTSTQAEVAKLFKLNPSHWSECRNKKRYVNGRFLAKCAVLMPEVDVRSFTRVVPADTLKAKQ